MSSKRSLWMHPSTNPSGLPNPSTTHSTGRDQPRPHSNVSNSGPTVHQSRPPPMVPQAPQGLPSPPLLDAEASHQMNRKKLPSSLCKNWSKSPTSYTKTTKPTNHLCQSPSCPNQTSIHPKRSLRQKDNTTSKNLSTLPTPAKTQRERNSSFAWNVPKN